MKTYILILPLLALFCSCRSREYIELRHRNYLRLYNDEIIVRITLFKNKDSAIIKVNHNEKVTKKKNKKFKLGHVKKTTKNYITTYDFKKIVDFLNAIKTEDLKQSKIEKDSTSGLTSFTYIGAHGGSNSISYKNNIVSKKYNVQGMSDLYKNFYEATMLIVEAARLEMKDVN